MPCLVRPPVPLEADTGKVDAAQFPPHLPSAAPALRLGPEKGSFVKSIHIPMQSQRSVCPLSFLRGNVHAKAATSPTPRSGDLGPFPQIQNRSMCAVQSVL